MKIEDLITVKNRALYDRVSTLYKVELRPGESTWGAVVVNCVAYISYTDTMYAEECFTHELLHVDTQMKGYRRILAGVSLQKNTNHALRQIIGCLDNEFQHHKMYTEYERMTYAAERFYHDSDIDTLNYLKKQLENKGLDFKRILPQYFTAIAPGGVMTQFEREEIKNLFHNYNNGIYKTQLQKLDGIIDAWKNDISYDAEPFIKQTCNLMDNIKTWITYEDLQGLNDNNFPSTGFFTDKKFTINDLVKVHGK
jgi:hypothetical protein